MLLLPLAVLAFAAKPTDYSTDMVMLTNGQTIQTLKLYASGQKSRVEGFTAGPLGKIVTIARKDKGLTWTLYLDKKQYTEKPLAATGKPGKPDLSNFDLGNLKKENLGRETVLGYSCTKMRVTMGNMPNGQPLTSTVWVADSLEMPIRLDAMGIVQENRNLKVVPQPASLFEIPAGFTKTNAPGMPAGKTPPAAAGARRAAGKAAGDVAGGVGGAVVGAVAGAAARYGGKNASAAASSAGGPAWKLNTNYPGGDYRSIDMATSDPTACKAACDQDAPCKAWTLVKPTEPGGMGYCWLKDSVPPAISEDCCISGLKGASGASTGSQSGFEMNIDRGGSDYRDFDPARADAALCAEACDKESRCKAWTWVKSEHQPPTGHCWLKDPAPDPAANECCVSGLKR
ncbi:MAG: DUF4412 domain-containing protein [Acidobacteria bacterium]|nr:DUF4412 domain-containing protein [Acidobacteriota bacterium]